MLVNITKAAKLAGISRDTFYKHYINKGKVSITKNHQDRPMVDTSEIMRVFGCLKDESHTDSKRQELTQEDTLPPPDFVARLATLEAENRQLLERLEEAKERENWQREKIDTLLDTVKLLEAPRNTTPPTAPPSQTERLKGFIDRVLGR